MNPVGLLILLILLNNQINHTYSYFKYRDDKIVRSILNATESSLNFDKYLDNDELDNFLNEFSHTYPEFTKVYRIGYSAQNRSLRVMAIARSINGKRTQLRPAIKLIANQYGNEAIGRQLLIYLVQFLLENYPQNGLIKHIVDTVEIHVLFSMNPDDFSRAKEGNCETNTSDRIG